MLRLPGRHVTEILSALAPRHFFWPAARTGGVLRILTEMFLIRGIVFSHEGIRKWEVKLTPALAENLRRRRRGHIGRSWYVNETNVKVLGEWRYLYRTVDRDRTLVGWQSGAARSGRKSRLPASLRRYCTGCGLT